MESIISTWIPRGFRVNNINYNFIHSDSIFITTLVMVLICNRNLKVKIPLNVVSRLICVSLGIFDMQKLENCCADHDHFNVEADI